MKKRRALVIVATILLCLGVLVARAMLEGRSALVRGDESKVEGDPEGAIRWWRRAARWYVPGAPHVSSAYQRLRGLGTAAEAESDDSIALAAWTGIRSSVRATRSFYLPFPDRLEEADTHIAVLMAKRESGASEELGQEALRARHYALLKLDQMPSVLWSIVALIGLALWIGGGFAFALRALDDEDRLVPKAAGYSGACIAIGLVIWLSGLHLA